jgi:DNA-binding NtrC family response regulator
MALEHLLHAVRARASRRRPVPRAPRVLVVDPNVKLRRAVLETLRRHDLTVAEAADILGALTALREWRPTVAVVELRLRNGRTGLEALHALQGMDPALRVVIHAAATDRTLGAEAARAGARIVFRDPHPGAENDLSGLVDAVRAAHRAHTGQAAAG